MTSPNSAYTEQQNCILHHNVFSLLDVSTLLEPKQAKQWETVTSIKLRIRSDHVMENGVVYYVAELVKKINALEGLQNFHLSIWGQRGRFGAAALASVIRVAEKLMSLDIRSGSIYGDTRDLAEALRRHPSLKSATLFNCHLFEEDRDLLPLIKALSENPILQHVALDSGILQSSSPGCVSEILAGFGRSKGLLSFKLRNCSAYELDDEDLLPLLKEVKVNQTMKEFSICDTTSGASQFGATLSAALGLMICYNTSLETLLLSVHPEAVSPTINGLRFNKTLKTLHLHAHYQPCLERIVETLEDVLRDDNYILEHCQLGIRPSSEVEYYLSLNRLGRHFLLTSNLATEEDWIKTISHQEQADIVLYFMLKNPALFCQQQPLNANGGAKRKPEWSGDEGILKESTRQAPKRLKS